MEGDAFLNFIMKKESAQKMHPRIAGFLKDYLANEKVVHFNNQYVLNTHFPPYPGRAFDNLVQQLNETGELKHQQLFSVTLAVTNQCRYHCWHCYNSGRKQTNIPLKDMKNIVTTLQNHNVANVTLSGGEPLLRDDLEMIIEYFDDTVSLTLNTTGDGLTPERAVRLKNSGLFALGVSLDSMDPETHDRLRGKPGAFQTAINALKMASYAGLYPYIISVATREFIHPIHFWPFITFAKDSRALEVHLLEPTATGKLAGNNGVVLNPKERSQILNYQYEIAKDSSLPILSTFLYLESADAFGCGAGLTHLYIDGTGEVCPCNLVPLSFGNMVKEPLEVILTRMGQHFKRPRTGCVGRILSRSIQSDSLPLSPEESECICSENLTQNHPVPKFFKIRMSALEDAGQKEVQSAYDQIHKDYDQYWLDKAAQPVDDLITCLSVNPYENIFEVGCGTGYATEQLCTLLAPAGTLTAVDLSKGMMAEAKKRIRKGLVESVTFIHGDALTHFSADATFDLIFSSWVLGYIPLKPFFSACARAMKPGGKLAFIVHKENSPREQLEIFGELIAKDPSALMQRVDFDFPPGLDFVDKELRVVGLSLPLLEENSITFQYDSPDGVLDHLLKSGAGTTFYEAIDPQRRDELTREFKQRLTQNSAGQFNVTHDYIACIAEKPGSE